MNGWDFSGYSQILGFRYCRLQYKMLLDAFWVWYLTFQGSNFKLVPPAHVRLFAHTSTYCHTYKCNVTYRFRNSALTLGIWIKRFWQVMKTTIGDSNLDAGLTCFLLGCTQTFNLSVILQAVILQSWDPSNSWLESDCFLFYPFQCPAIEYSVRHNVIGVIVG